MQELGKQDEIIGKVGKKVLDLNENGQFVYTMTEEEEAYFREDGINELKKEVRIQGILEGKELGRIEGRLEGMLDGIIKMAQMMIRENEPIKKISKYITLSLKDINKFEKNLNKENKDEKYYEADEYNKLYHEYYE